MGRLEISSRVVFPTAARPDGSIALIDFGQTKQMLGDGGGLEHLQTRFFALAVVGPNNAFLAGDEILVQPANQDRS